MNINWTMLSAIAEIISSFAIVVTLIYLSIQTRQNTAATRANTRQTMINNDLIINNAGIDHPHILTLLDSNHSHQKLSADEEHQIALWLVNLARSREYQWFQYKNGLLDKQTWQAYLTGLAANLTSPRARGWWDAVAHDYFDHEFVEAVNKYLKKTPVSRHYTSPFDQNKPAEKL